LSNARRVVRDKKKGRTVAGDTGKGEKDHHQKVKKPHPDNYVDGDRHRRSQNFEKRMSSEVRKIHKRTIEKVSSSGDGGRRLSSAVMGERLQRGTGLDVTPGKKDTNYFDDAHSSQSKEKPK